MGLRVILTEKPSVAWDFANALGAQKEGSFFKKGNTLIVYARGHLYEIADDNAPKAWRMEDLPILPEAIEWSPRKGAGQLLREITQALKGAEEVVIATDPGREGELIARIILKKLGWKKWNRTYRFWTAEALTPPVVRKGLASLKAASEYDSLYYSALARAEGDWLVGVNLTRAVSLGKGGGEVWSVGRVQTPTLKLVVEREKEIRSFKPTPYGVLKASFRLPDGFAYQGVWQAGEPHPPLEKVRQVEAKLSGAREGKVREVREKEEVLPPPLLHNLASLQRAANARYGLSAKQTLDAAQALYEVHKAISYPRTESRHLPESARSLVEEVLRKLGREDLLPAVPKAGKRVFDDRKLTDHHALIPLAPLPPGASPVEAKVYTLVLSRFLASFSPPAKLKRAEVVTEVMGETFLSKFKVFTERGWTAEESYQPSVEEGESGEIEDLFPGKEGSPALLEELRTEEKKTSPPPRYTEGSLIKAMEKLGLGTPATRAEILETLKKRHYLSLQKKALVPTEKAFQLIEVLEGSPVSDVGMTAEWEEKLSLVWRNKEGSRGYEAFVSGIKGFVRTSVESLKEKWAKMGRSEENPMEERKGSSSGKATSKMLAYAKALAKGLGKKPPGDSFEEVKAFIEKAKAEMDEPVGTCGCGKPVRRTPWGWKCEGGHAVFRETFGTKLKLEEALALLGGEKLEKAGLKGKNGKPFAARLVYNHQEGKIRIAEFVKAQR